MVANFDEKRPGLTNACKTPGIADFKVLVLKYVGRFTDESSGLAPAFFCSRIDNHFCVHLVFECE